MMQLSIRNVVKKLGDATILGGVSFEVEAGETVAIIGPSGAGKSTLLRCVNGLTSFDAGEIRVGEHHLDAAAPRGERFLAERAVRRVFGMVFQDYQLFPHLSALENVALAPRLVLGRSAAEAGERARALLGRVGLAGREGAYPRELSGGQKQRVAIARALAMEPRGILCDEITSALDPELRREVVAVLEGLRKDGLTLLLATHELAFARRAADRVVFMEHGRIVELGTAAEVLERPRHERTQRFLAAF